MTEIMPTKVALVASVLSCLLMVLAGLTVPCWFLVVIHQPKDLPIHLVGLSCFAEFGAIFLFAVPALCLAAHVGRVRKAERRSRIRSEPRSVEMSMESTCACPRCSRTLTLVALSEQLPGTLDRETLPGNHFECLSCRRWFQLVTSYQLNEV